MSEVLEPASYSVLGGGGDGVGASLIRMAEKPEVAARHGLQLQPDMVSGKDGWHEGSRDGPLVESRLDRLPDSEVLFVTMPSVPDNEPMASLIRRQLARGDTVVTVEKRTVADNLAEFRNYPGQLLTWGCVGGGAKLVPVLEYFTIDPANIRELATGTNGTFATMFDRFASGDSPGNVVDAVTRDRLIEPGATDIITIAQSEAEDVAVKTVIALKMLIPGFEDLQRSDIKTVLTTDHIMEAIDKAYKYRYLVDIFPEDAEEEAERVNASRLGGFKELRRAGFIAIGGFLDINTTDVLKRFHRIEPGPTAAFYTRLGPADGSTKDGIYGSQGDGAGPDATATAALDNYWYFRKLQAARADSLL